MATKTTKTTKTIKATDTVKKPGYQLHKISHFRSIEESVLDRFMLDGKTMSKAQLKKLTYAELEKAMKAGKLFSVKKIEK